MRNAYSTESRTMYAMYTMYTHDSLLTDPDKDEIDKMAKDLKKATLNITGEGDIQDFLGVNIDIKKMEQSISHNHIW